MALTLKVVTPRGVEFEEEGLDRIVLRRREADHVPGSEVAICDHHANLLMQSQRSSMRLTRGEQSWEVPAGAGVLEVDGEAVTLVITDEC